MENPIDSETVNIDKINEDYIITVTHESSGSGDCIAMSGFTLLKLKNLLTDYQECPGCKKPTIGDGKCDKCHGFDMYMTHMY